MAKYDWSKFGLHVPEIMLPKEGTDYFKWAVVACDQFTSEPEYWEKVEEIVGDAPSTLRLMLPELYLDKPGEAERIKDIRATMDKYLADGTLRTMVPGCMLIKRTAEGRSRLGLVIATDLEAYDFSKGSNSLTRATEGTVVERIPPRLRIRGDAPIEMPHILILIDDPGKTVIEPLVDAPKEVIYDTDLMMEGGHITGSFIKKRISKAQRKLFPHFTIRQKRNTAPATSSSRPWETATTLLLQQRLHGRTSRRLCRLKRSKDILQDTLCARSRTSMMTVSYLSLSTESFSQIRVSREWIS